MTPNAIYSKSGKGVQEASGKTSLLSRGDRAVLSAFDGKVTVKEVADRVGKTFDAKFEQIIRQLERDGFVREVSAGAPGKAAAPGAARPTPAKPPSPAAAGGSDELDFTSMPASKQGPVSRQGAAPPATPPDLAAKARAEAERKAKEEQALSYKTRQEAEAKAAAAAKLRAHAEEKAKRQRERIKAQAPAKAPAGLEVSFGAEIAIPGKADVDVKGQASAFAKAREEAEEKAQKDRDRIKAEAEARLLAETEAKLRSEAEIKEKEIAEAKRQAEAAAQVKAAHEAELRAAFEAERAKAREEAERARKEAEELRQRLEDERKARDEADRARKEAEEKARKEEERRAREEAERRAREEQERKARDERERKGREEQERKAREEAERKARDDQERRAREEAARAKEQAERALQEVERAQREAKEKEKKKPAPAATGDQFTDSLMADFDSFNQREDEEIKAKEEFVRKEKEDAARRAGERAEAERKAREESDRQKREEDDRRRKEEEERLGRELREREARERQEREARESAERERKALAARIEETAAAVKADDDIPVTDSDLDMDDVKRDRAAVSKESRKATREREREAKEREAEAKERAKERKREAKRASAAPPPPVGGSYAPIRRRRSWGKPIAVILFLLLGAGIGVLHLMPLETQEYEKVVSEAIGQPVKIRSANLSLYKGAMLRMEGVSIGEAKIATVRAYPEIGTLFDEKKAFSRIELDGVSLPQRDLGAVLGAKVKSDRFSVAHVRARQLKLEGLLTFPPLEADMVLARDGSVSTVSFFGADSLSAKLTPKGANVEFDVTANSFTLPIAPDVTLSAFAMKGVARGDGMRIDSWGGGNFDGAVSGTATIRWGSNWNIDGVLTVRGMSGAMFAPTLLYEGKVEGTGKFSVNGPDPTKFMERGRLEGSFSVPRGVLGTFDLSRAIRTGGREAAGYTPFTGLSAQGLFDKGAIALRNVTFRAGALNAGASADIAADGALSGRIVADIRTSSQTLRATVTLGGTLKEPQVKN